MLKENTATYSKGDDCARVAKLRLEWKPLASQLV